MTEDSGFLKRDIWLEEALGYEVFRLSADHDMAGRLGDPQSAERQTLEALQGRNVMIYARVKPLDIPDFPFLFELGFRLVDTNVTMRRELTDEWDKEGDEHICFAVPEDEVRVVDLARRSFSFSRFHLDPHIRNEDADRLKGEWARNFFRGRRGDAMVVAHQGDLAVGFLQLLYDKNELVIDLIAVDQRYRSRGFARKIILYAALNCRGFKGIRVGTQIANLPSIRLYETMGFRILSFEHVFHYHNHRVP